jgi:hypothetical protein
MQKGLPKTVCATAGQVLDRVARDLEPGEGRTLREPSGVHMALRVRRLADDAPSLRFVVGHYHESAVGTAQVLVGDPEVMLLRTESGDWVPVSFRTPFTHVVSVEAHDSVRLLRGPEHPRLVKLVEVWMRNVEANLLDADGLEEEIGDAPAYAAE